MTWKRLLVTPTADGTADILARDVIGSKGDAAVLTSATTKSLTAYSKGILNAVTAASPNTFVPGLGYRVTKTEDGSTATSDDLFTLTGKVLITLWTMEVTNALGATAKFSDYQITMTTLNGVLLAAGDISSAAVGHMFNMNSDAGDTSLSSSTGAVSVTGVADFNGKSMSQRVVGKAGGSDVIKSVRTAGDAGDAIIHTVFYLPLEENASLVAAA